MSGAALDQMMRGRAPIEIRASSRSLRARVHGTLDDPAGSGGPELSLSLAAGRLSDATRWLKLSAGAADLPLAIEGKARWHDNEWSISGLKFAVGRNALTGDFAQSRQGKRPVLRVRLVADTLDLTELQTMLPKSDGRTGGERPILDLPILPAGIDLSDTDFQVDVKRLAGGALPLTDLKFNAQMRDGRMLASPFSANVSGTRFEGAVALDLRGKQPQAELWLGAEDADIGRMLRSLGLVENIEASAGKLVVHGVARGARLGELSQRSELLAELAAGRIVLSDPNTRAQAVIRLETGTLRADPGAPVTLALKGDLDGTPVAIDLQSGKLAELVRPDQQVRFNLKADAVDARLEIVGNVLRPISARELEFAMSLSGPRLDALSAIARTPLPPWGSYSLIGRLKLSRSGYEVAGMRLRIGDSTLRGDGRLDTAQTPPRLAVTLTAPSIQLDDFKLGDGWPFEKKAAAGKTTAPKPLSADELRNQAAQASAQAEKLLSPEVLRRQDATLNIQVDQVLSGTDALGSGRLVAKINKGRADLGPIEVAVPGGSARLAFAFEPTGREVNAEAHIQVERFDYGILARRALPNSDLRGSFSLQFDVTSQAPSLAQAMQHGNGTIDFTVWPENLRAGVFDLWAANLFVSLAAKVDPSSASKINCGIGRFTLTDGVLNDRQILLDTTRVRVQGQGKADFHDESIALRLRPTPKQAQFFSLATPIQVSGSFTEPQIGVDPGAVLETAARLATSLLWVPVQKLIGKEVPADGSDVCERTPR